MESSKKSSREAEVLRRLKVFRYVDFFETYIREKIERKLREHYGDEWWEKGVPEEVRDSCKKLAEKERSCEPLINFTDLGDYISIITSKENWNIFSSLFNKPPQSVRTYLFEFKKLRGKACHIRPLSDDDVQKAEVFVRELCGSDEGAIGEFEKIKEGKMLSHTEIRIVHPLVFHLNGWGTKEEISNVIGHINYDLRKLLKLMEEGGLLECVSGAKIASGIVLGAPRVLPGGEGRKLPSPRKKVYLLASSSEEMLNKHREIEAFKKQ
ncbi:MAG: Swt1 family HEPN domain-containing protein [Candidatus Jordarchaeaceae archaeon]